MGRSLLSSRANGGWRRILGLFCVLLVIFAASAELIHSHDSGGIHADCSLCVTAHSAVQATVHTVAPTPMRRVARLVEVQPLFVRRQFNIRLSIRPPPVSPAVA